MVRPNDIVPVIVIVDITRVKLVDDRERAGLEGFPHPKGVGRFWAAGTEHDFGIDEQFEIQMLREPAAKAIGAENTARKRIVVSGGFDAAHPPVMRHLARKG